MVMALAFGLIVAPAAAGPGGDDDDDDDNFRSATGAASDAQASGFTEQAAATAQATVEGPSDWCEILPGLTMGSQLRLRAESRRNAKFDGARPGNDEDYLLSRFRFDLTWRPSDRVSGVVELQDARIHGERAISETRTPNIFADQLDVHQAYLDVGSPASGSLPVTLRIGRQKLVYGSQRMVSPLEWVNTARVFDGARITAGGGPGRKLDAFATRLVPVKPNGLNDDGPTGSRMFNSQFHGVYYTDTALVAGSTVEGYWLLRRAARLDDAVHTIGTRVDTRRGPWAFDGELATQTGSYGGLEQRAALVHVGGSYTTALPGRLKFGFSGMPGPSMPGPMMAAARSHHDGRRDPADMVEILASTRRTARLGIGSTLPLRTCGLSPRLVLACAATVAIITTPGGPDIGFTEEPFSDAGV